jgi:integrase
MQNISKNHHLNLRNSTWYFLAMVNGTRVKKALSTSVTEARSLRDLYLKEISLYGEIISLKSAALEATENSVLFGEVATEWSTIIKNEVKSSTLRDYKSAMNFYILPHFGNTPISEISYANIESFRAKLTCSSKRKNNVLVPMRAVMQFAYKSELIDKNPMDLVANLRVDKADIHPLSIDEVFCFLDVVDPYYKSFFIVAFFTGMRFGEMSALKWKNVCFKRNVIQVRETRVNGEEGRPKTKGSLRDINMMPPVIEAMKDQKQITSPNSPYVFLNKNIRPLTPASTNFLFWKPALKKAGLEKRSLYQTRHTFASLMLDSGEIPGWVQKMMGHSSLKMILEHYYSHIQNYQRDDGSAFMENVYKKRHCSEEVKQDVSHKK